MKQSEFKKIVKTAVKEAIQEELKDILFEAFKSQTNSPTITESYTPPAQNITPPSPTTPVMSLEEKRSKYEEALNGTALSFTSQNAQTFVPQTADPVNGNLGTGNVSMDQITSLLNK